MRIELVSGTSNVLRFPVERRARPTLELLRDIAPDVRQVWLLAESFGLPLPEPGWRDAMDAHVAEHILNHVRPEPGPARRIELEAVLAPVLARAVAACRAAHEAALAATVAQDRVVQARSEGGHWLEPLVGRAEALTTAAAHLLIEAHLRAEEAEGAARAVGMALRGENWEPRSVEQETEWLCEAQRRAAAR